MPNGGGPSKRPCAGGCGDDVYSDSDLCDDCVEVAKRLLNDRTGTTVDQAKIDTKIARITDRLEDVEDRVSRLYDSIRKI